MRFRLKRPSHATVVAYLALFAALGGGAYAATKVSSKQIVNNSVQGKDVKDNSLTGADVRESTLATVPSAGRAGTAATTGSVRTFGASIDAVDHTGHDDKTVTLFTDGTTKLQLLCLYPLLGTHGVTMKLSVESSGGVTGVGHAAWTKLTGFESDGGRTNAEPDGRGDVVGPTTGFSFPIVDYVIDTPDAEWEGQFTFNDSKGKVVTGIFHLGHGGFSCDTYGTVFVK